MAEMGQAAGALAVSGVGNETELEGLFPGLREDGYRIQSPAEPRYNCIAWAAGDSTRWWWPMRSRVPGCYWPANVPAEETLDSFAQAFAVLGYVACESAELEPGLEKVALYVDDKGIPTHAARQLVSGVWTSKVGQLQDIEHVSLRGLEGQEYGTVARVLKKPRAQAVYRRL